MIVATGILLATRVPILADAAASAAPAGAPLYRPPAADPVTAITAGIPPSPQTPHGWRGDGTGVFPFTNPPTTWAPPEGANAAKNIRWQMKFDGETSWGNAQPILVGKRLFVFREPTIMGCLDADSGAILWKRDVNVLWALQGEEFQKHWTMWQERQKAVEGMMKGDEAAKARLKELDKVLIPKVQLHGDGCQTKYMKGYGLATPVTDGTLIYVKNGSGVLAAVDLDGNVKWAQNIGYNGTHSSVSSPCLVDGRVIISKPATASKLIVLTAFDARTGAPLWQSDPRLAGAGDGCPSPTVLRLKGIPVVITSCGDVVRAADGKILAQEVGSQGFTTPIVHGDVVFFTAKDGTVAAVRLDVDGDKATGTRLWAAKPLVEGKNSLSYGSLVYYDGYVHMLQDRGEYSVINAGTGEVVHSMHAFPSDPDRGKSAVYGNLCVAGGKIYGFDDRGRSVVVRAGPKGEVIARNEHMLGYGTGSPLFVGNRIYVRRSYKPELPSWIYCLEEAKP